MLQLQIYGWCHLLKKNSLGIGHSCIFIYLMIWNCTYVIVKWKIHPPPSLKPTLLNTSESIIANPKRPKRPIMNLKGLYVYILARNVIKFHSKWYIFTICNIPYWIMHTCKLYQWEIWKCISDLDSNTYFVFLIAWTGHRYNIMDQNKILFSILVGGFYKIIMPHIIMPPPPSSLAVSFTVRLVCDIVQFLVKMCL